MAILQMLLLALALCIDSFVVATTYALTNSLRWKWALILAAIFAFFQGVFPLLGCLLGFKFHNVIAAVDHWIAFGLFLIVGVKMIVEGLSPKQEHRQEHISVWMLCSLGIATSIDAFVIGIGLGLQYSLRDCLVTCLVIGATTFEVSLAGCFLGRRNPFRFGHVATIVAGIVFIGMGVFTLVEHGVFG